MELGTDSNKISPQEWNHYTLQPSEGVRPLSIKVAQLKPPLKTLIHHSNASPREVQERASHSPVLCREARVKKKRNEEKCSLIQADFEQRLYLIAVNQHPPLLHPFGPRTHKSISRGLVRLNQILIYITYNLNKWTENSNFNQNEIEKIKTTNKSISQELVKLN